MLEMSARGEGPWAAALPWVFWLERRYGLITFLRLLTGLGSDIDGPELLSGSPFVATGRGIEVTGFGIGNGGGSSVTDFLRRRKKDEGFFCRAGWCECEEDVSRDGGVEVLADILVSAGGVVCAGCVSLLFCELLFLEEPKTLLKNPGRSFAGAVAVPFPDELASLDFPYPTFGAGAESKSMGGSTGAGSR